MKEEIFPGIHIIHVPIPHSNLGFLNAYLLRSDQGSLLVDAGWNDEAAWQALQCGIRESDTSLQEITTAVITHTHPDHYGLAGRLAATTPARLVLHAAEQAALVEHSQHCSEYSVELAAWFHSHGMAVEGSQMITPQVLEALGLIPAPMPTRLIKNGEHLRIGDFDLEVLWTPGHSPGHICLYDQQNGILFCGDHILARITPNISLQDGSGGNPLGDYLQSLERITNLDVRLALPGHGEVITDIPVCINRIRKHHRQRSDEVLAALQEGPLDASQVANRVRWVGQPGSFNRLPPLQRRLALTETLAHLEYLRAENAVCRVLEKGIYLYFAISH